MSKARIFCFGMYDLPDVEGYESFDLLSDQSWLDADVIVLRPTLQQLSSSSSFQGKRSIDEHPSFRVKSAAANWPNKITTALNAGKSVVYILPPLEAVNIDTGNRSYSGTGRNRQTTRLLADFDNYEFIGLNVGRHKPVFESGSNIVRTRDIGPLATFYSRYEGRWRYNCHFTADALKCALTTAAGGFCVGAYSRTGVVFMPDIIWPGDDEMWEEDDDGDLVATTLGKQESINFRDELLALHRSLRSGAERTPAPKWSSSETYVLPDEPPIQSNLTAVRSDILTLEEKKAALEAELEEAGELRSLLFETGKPLERAVRKALELLRFKVSTVDDGQSEFDAVFESDEGRFIGEVEGREKAINVAKISQLRRNVDEDFARDEVTTPAIGVLFGNGYRLAEPADRAECFTEKVVSSAPALGIALVSTIALFEAVRLWKQTGSDEFARQCRRAIADSVGEIVKFPSVATVSSDGVQTR